jgi:hypothetical protein
MSSKLALAFAVGLASCALASCSDDASQLDGGSSGGGSSSSGTTSGDPGTTTPDDGTGSGTSGTTTPGAGGTAASICVATINEYRKTKGLPPYAAWTEGETCADGEAKSDASTGKAHGAFGKCQEFAQNECPGWAGPADTMIPQCLKAMWGEGPGGGHYEAMASKKYTKVACGFSAATGSAIWSVQNFR